MVFLRCLTCMPVRKKRKSESQIALLVHTDGDTDENYTGKIPARKLSWNDHSRKRAIAPAGPGNGDEDHDLADEDYSTSKNDVRRYSWDEIQRLRIWSFSWEDYYYRGFSMVYVEKRLKKTSPVVMKFYKGRRVRIYKHELEILLLLRHDNIVKLLGYCDDQEEGVLVFEHAVNGTLRGILCGIVEPSWGRKQSDVLSWRIRMKIAYQLAQAIEYLHEKCPLQIIHGNINPSNILLDDKLNCRLCNFSSAQIGTDHGSSSSKGQFVVDYPGYTDFHFLSTGIALKQHDIYSFGIIVLELMTGIEAPSLHSRGSVASQAESMMRDEGSLVKMVDPRLKLDFDMEEARTMASVSAMCLCSSPGLRPSAADIVQEIRSNVDSINEKMFKK